MTFMERIEELVRSLEDANRRHAAAVTDRDAWRLRAEGAERERDRLRAFAKTVRDEPGGWCRSADCWESGRVRDPATCPCGGDECWKCAAAQALTPPPWAIPASPVSLSTADWKCVPTAVPGKDHQP